jgi:hypothetical protein
VKVGQEAESPRDEIAELRAALAREERIASALREGGQCVGDDARISMIFSS